MKQRTNQVLFAYWNDVRGARMAPNRFEVEPSSIAPILSETFILERTARDDFRYRIAGTRLCDQFGCELRGKNFLDDWRAADVRVLARVCQAVCNDGVVAPLTFEASTAEGRKCAFEATLMPLLHAGNGITRLLGAMSALSPPPWLGSERLFGKALLAHETIWPDGRPHAVAAKLREPTILSALSGARLVKVDKRSFRVLDGGRGKPQSEEL